MRVVTLCGSLRGASYNRRLLRAATIISKEAGAVVEEVDLKELAVPIYDGDIEEEGMPSSVETLRDAIEGADVLLIASPEYNHSITGALKNAIDWASRKPNVLNGKAAAIFGASPGRMGTVRSQMHLREILGALNVSVTLKPELFVGSVDADSFTDDDHLTDEKAMEILRELVEKTIAHAKKEVSERCDENQIDR